MSFLLTEYDLETKRTQWCIYSYRLKCITLPNNIMPTPPLTHTNVTLL